MCMQHSVSGYLCASPKVTEDVASIARSYKRVECINHSRNPYRLLVGWDVTFDLETGKYYPFRKPNDTAFYIHAESNHPPSIVKQLPGMISRRISDISCNKEEFEKAKHSYEDALKSSGHKPEMVYQEPAKK